MVKLVSITKPINRDIQNFKSEDMMSYIARVSNPKNQLNKETTSKLLKYCIDNQHWSVFEHCYMTVEIKTSLAIATQILRHKSFCFQQFSQRYSEAQDFDFYEARRQDTKNRQNSIDDMSIEDETWFYEAQQKVVLLANELYKAALDKGIAKEQARFLLPQLTQTKLYMTGNVRSFIHYLALRTGNGTQKEHQEIAEEIRKIFIEQFPTISEALQWKNLDK